MKFISALLALLCLCGCKPDAQPKYQLCAATVHAGIITKEKQDTEKIEFLFRLDTITGEVWQLLVTDIGGTNDAWRKVTAPAPRQ